MITYPYTTKALKVEQPIGIYYVAILPAELLLQVAFSDALSARYVEGSQSYVLDGTQRLPQPNRLEPIAKYLNRVDAAFPNAIILAANYRKEDGNLEDTPEAALDDQSSESSLADDAVEEHERQADVGHVSSQMQTMPVDRQWTVEEAADGCHLLTIPTGNKLAAIIDGQHRLFAFTRARADRHAMALICSVFLDLPKPYQAQLFATINSTQKPVDKSLTYELFGYNVAEEPEVQWSPDKLAVFLTRRLNTEQGSPLEGRIIIAPKKDEVLAGLGEGKSWKVSTAVVVEGVMRLFTSNPKSDAAALLEEPKRTRTFLADARKDRSPLRSAYLEANDLLIYTLVLNYLRACQQLFWENAGPKSYITKTIGVQALFDILRMKVARDAVAAKTISAQHFVSILKSASHIDFSDERFRNLSGSGRTFIRKEIEAAAGLGLPSVNPWTGGETSTA
jgi:DNA phosphorothioation-associated DGQHR protein 1